jgi:hypothetical protein
VHREFGGIVRRQGARESENFTLGRAALETSFRIGGISTAISAGAVRAKVPGFPWPVAERST